MTNTIAAAEHARARARRAAIADGTAYTVRFTTDDGVRREAVEGRYDAIGLARDLVFNPGFSGVELERPDGRVIDAAAIPSLRY